MQRRAIEEARSRSDATRSSAPRSSSLRAPGPTTRPSSALDLTGVPIGGAPADPRAIAESGLVGAPRPLPYRREMEARFGLDLGDLEVFTDGPARRASALLHAEGYTLGHRIGLASASPRREVVAHEVTHALQYARGVDQSDRDGIYRGGEAEAEAAERSVAAGRAPRLTRPRRRLREAHGRGPALKGFGDSRGWNDSKATPGRLTVNASTNGAGTAFEWQLAGIKPPKWPITPWLYGQMIPEIKFLGKMGSMFGGPMAGTTQLAGTISGRTIFILSGGVVQVAEVFGSLTGQVDGNAVANLGGDDVTLTLEAVARVSGRVGVRAVRRSLEGSFDLFSAELARARLRVKRSGGEWSVVEAGVDWGADAKRIARWAESYFDEKELEAGSWLQRNIEEPIKRYLTPNGVVW